MQLETIWKQVLAEIELQVSSASFLTWFQETRVLEEENGVVRVAVPNGFVREWLKGKYYKYILRSLRSQSQDIKEVEFVIDPRSGQAAAVIPVRNLIVNNKDVSINKSPRQLIFQEFSKDPETQLNPRYNFDSFVVGPSNELAHAAATAVASHPGVKYNPLFIYGGVGLGKTHLLQAIGNEIKKVVVKPLRVFYVSTEQFKNDVVAAIRLGSPERLNEYKNVNVLIIDDIQFLAGKERTQVEFFHLFNLFYNNNRQVVISSDRAPKALPMIEERLRSRFEAGMITDISQPEFETRLAILRRKALERGLVINDETLEYIARNLERNIRELEGALNAVEAASSQGKRDLKLIEVERILLPLTRRPITLSLKQVIKTVAEFYELTEAQLVDKSRKKEIVKPRQIAMYLLRAELKISFPSIGERFSSRDHTTVMHACEKIQGELTNKPEIQEEIQLIRERLYNAS